MLTQLPMVLKFEARIIHIFNTIAQVVNVQSRTKQCLSRTNGTCYSPYYHRTLVLTTRSSTQSRMIPSLLLDYGMSRYLPHAHSPPPRPEWTQQAMLKMKSDSQNKMLRAIEKTRIIMTPTFERWIYFPRKYCPSWFGYLHQDRSHRAYSLDRDSSNDRLVSTLDHR